MHHWAAAAGRRIGAILDVPTLWRLSQRWYEGRLASDWRPRTGGESQRILEDVGLTGPFWALTG